MRILSVVTLVSPRGDFGGPVRVAVNQARALTERGHDVVLAGGHRGFDGPAPRSLDGVPTALFPARRVVPGAGFAGLAAPGLYRWLASAAGRFDIVHVHAARDLVTLPAAHRVHRAGIPYVMQTHGMIDPSSNPLARPLDAVLTRPLLRTAKRVFCLTPSEQRDLRQVGGDALAFQELPNGVPLPRELRNEPTETEVLYLARLAPRKRPMVFVEMARSLATEYPNVRFTLVGPDEGEGTRVEQAAADEPAGRLSWEGPLAPEATGGRMAAASIYVLPSIDEPFGMTVLEAMALGLPVVVTDSCALAPMIRRTQCGLVTDATQDGMNAAVRSLLADPDLARTMGERGTRTAREEFSMPAVADILEDAYST